MSRPDEFEVKGRFWNTPTVNARLTQSFLAADVPKAAVALAGLVGEVPGADEDAADLATCRLMLAAIRVSEGDPVKLAMWVDVAHHDPRDLIAAAEYPRELLGDESAREVDFADYLTWVSGGRGAE